MSGETGVEVGDFDTRGKIVEKGSREALEKDSGISEEGDVGM